MLLSHLDAIKNCFNFCRAGQVMLFSSRNLSVEYSLVYHVSKKVVLCDIFLSLFTISSRFDGLIFWCLNDPDSPCFARCDRKSISKSELKNNNELERKDQRPELILRLLNKQRSFIFASMRRVNVKLNSRKNLFL